jgi:hypothetical protein
VDFYCYQSGHQIAHAHRPYTLAEKSLAYPNKRPLLNSEPPYEGHGRLSPDGSRWTREEVRKAAWQSLLSGAKMGIAYGGHGVWSFHRRGFDFLAKDRSLEPFDWEDALALPGASDMGFARWLFETKDLFSLDPAPILRTGAPEARAMASGDGRRIAIYSPYATDLVLDRDLAGFDVVAIDLSTRFVLRPRVQAGEPSMIEQLPVNADCLVLADWQGQP